MKVWLSVRDEPKTMLAVTVAKELQLSELRLDIELLREEIQLGEAFMPFYLRWVDEALASLNLSQS